MLPALDRKMVSITPPGAIVDNASWTTDEIDTLGWDYMIITFYFGAMDIAMAALKVTHSDTSGSGHTDIDGLDFSSDGTLPSATDDNTISQCFIDLRGKKRYIDVTATGGDGTAGTYLAIHGELWRGEQSLQTVAAQGLSQRLIA